MAEQMLKAISRTVKEDSNSTVYRLIFKNALYSIECYRESKDGDNNYCFIENLTEDEGEAETFLQLISNGKVHPVHIRDLAEDYFGIHS